MMYMYHSFLIHSSPDGHLGCFHVLALINSAAMNIGVHMFLSDLISSVCMPRSGIAGSYGSSKFSLLSRGKWFIIKWGKFSLLSRVNYYVKANESWTIKKAEHWRIDAFEMWCWRRLLRVPWTPRWLRLSILKKISLTYSMEGLMLQMKLQYFGHLMRINDSL